MNTFRVALGLAAVATLGVAVWLVSVIVFILPTLDPGHVRLWWMVAGGLFAYVGLSWAHRAAPRAVVLAWVMALASVGAIAAGIYGIADQWWRMNRGEDFEGYIVLMGLVVIGHGLVALAHVLVARRSRHEVA